MCTDVAVMDELSYLPGPQLKKFDTKGKELDIEFIQHLGSGAHAHVWKVYINGDLYALKLVPHCSSCSYPNIF